MGHHSILKSKTALSLLGAVFLSMAGLVHAQIKTPGQGDSMQRPSDSMQPPVIPGKPFEKGTTRGEEAESKNRFDKNEAEAARHKLNTNQGYGSKRDGGSDSGSGGY
ncbi:hypothetical protein [Nitrosovibrio tenuis]|uniref:Uncharacterized protein n=1 Tax=Nitrosovibrio tenuis TaxID=1233 RepID=A0A1H7KNC1_9PROT|nr:hypothetical protein [Nitrosovibrio tenuis]SEK88282.1 hypothetical protein SAMN05216387_103287 [Nitrosovibrio tenuis]